MTTIREVIEANIKYPKCPFEKMKLNAQLDRCAIAIEKHINDRATADSADVQQGTQELRKEC